MREMRTGFETAAPPSGAAGETDMKVVPVHAQSEATISGRLLVLACCGLMLSACVNPYHSRLPPEPVASRQPVPLDPAPRSPVEGSELRPTSPDTTDIVEVPSDPENSVEVASVNPANGQPVSRDALIGAWTVSTGGTNCQIFLALTKWSGGFRAASRGCSAPAIADVQAWDVRGKQVVLVDSNGGTAATLIRSGDTRYNGSTSGGGAITFSR